MDITIHPHRLYGTVDASPSKSQAHRLLICSAFADRETEIICPGYSQDIDATVQCLNALGAKVQRTSAGFLVTPITDIPASATLNCRESGSTLRFMLPICGALGVEATFFMDGRLADRPLSPLWEEMERMGCHLSKTDNLHCSGKLQAGDYRIAGNVSSQFITGLMFALALMEDGSTLTIEGILESAPYVDMTKEALELFGVSISGNKIAGTLCSPGKLTVEGDWSNAAFFLAADALGNAVTVKGLNPESCQGDRKISDLLPKLSEKVSISCRHIPDLVPILAVTVAALKGAEFTDIRRLRIKESDRVQSVQDMLLNFGCQSFSTENALTVFPGKFHGCTIDAVNDHRIAMAAAMAATITDGPVTILGAQCVSKSYPDFWQDYKKLGGVYEQLIR